MPLKFLASSKSTASYSRYLKLVLFSLVLFYLSLDLHFAFCETNAVLKNPDPDLDLLMTYLDSDRFVGLLLMVLTYFCYCHLLPMILSGSLLAKISGLVTTKVNLAYSAIKFFPALYKYLFVVSSPEAEAFTFIVSVITEVFEDSTFVGMLKSCENKSDTFGMLSDRLEVILADCSYSSKDRTLLAFSIARIIIAYLL